MKLKSLISRADKKILLVIMLIVACMAVCITGCGKKGGKDDVANASQSEETEPVDNTDTEQTSEIIGETSEETDNGQTDEPSGEVQTTEKEETKPNNETQVNQPETKPSQSQSQTQAPTNPQTEAPTVKDDGESGTSYLVFPDANLSVTTVDIAAGKTVHYDVYRVGGKILEINSSDAYVTYNGKKYTSQNGVVTVKIDRTTDEAVGFDIGNGSFSKKSFKLQFKDVMGSQDAPEVLTSVAGSHNVYLEAGNDQGYNYSYVVEQTGTLVFYVSSVSPSSVSAGISATAIGDNDVPVNRNTAETDDGKIEIVVQKGQKMNINIYIAPNIRGKIPEGTVTWVAEYK